jgi:hypothetical protein
MLHSYSYRSCEDARSTSILVGANIPCEHPHDTRFLGADIGGLAAAVEAYIG